MATLNELNDSNSLTIQDLVPDAQEKPPVINKATASNVAAHAALLSDDPSAVVENYGIMSSQLQQEGQSALADNLINSAQKAEQDQAKKVLPTLLADKTISDADKLNALEQVYNSDMSMYHPTNILAARALTQDIPSEPVESQDVRLDFADVLHMNSSIREEQQNLYNQAVAEINPDTKNKVLDFFQMMVPGVNQLYTARVRSAVTGETAWSYLKSFVLSGSAQDDIRQAIINAPPEKRLEMTQRAIDAVMSSNGILGGNQNQLNQLRQLQAVVVNQYIEDDNKWVDNIASVADMVMGIGAAGKAINSARALKAGEAELKAADTLAAGYNGKGPTGAPSASGGPSGGTGPRSGGATFQTPNLIESKVQPLSVAQTVKDVNPNMYKSMHEAAASDETGQVAEALYGASKNDVIVHDLGPQTGKVDNSVKAKVANADAINVQNITPDATLEHFINRDGALYYTDAQKQANVSRIVNDFDHAFGVTTRREMVQVVSPTDAKLVGNTVTLRTVYGPQASGFRYPQEAMETVKYALRNYGVDEQHITLLKRVGGEYVPVDKNTVRGGEDPGFINVASDADIKQAYDAGHYAETVVKGNKIRVVGADHGGNTREVIAFDQDGNQIGSVLYGTDPVRLDNPNVRVNPDWQRKGVANAMYDYAEKHGAKFPSNSDQKFLRSEAGQAFRDARASSNRPKLQFSGNGGGDYLVQVDHNYKFNPFTMSDWGKYDVKNNWFMRSGAFIGDSGAGSLQRHLVNINSMLDPHITLSAMKAVTKSAGIEREFIQMAKDVSSKYAGLKAHEKIVAWDMIKEANYKGIHVTDNAMTAAGLSDKAKDFLHSWRNYWDQHWYFENIDYNKTVRNLGYMRFVDSTNDVNLVARPIKRSTIGAGIQVYNSSMDKVVHLRPEDLDELYIHGGVVAELWEPLEVSGKTIQHVMSPEVQNAGYLRAINPEDAGLAYRPGYFSVKYKEPIFIVKNVYNEAGKKVGEKAVATSANTKDAEIMIKRLKSTDGGDYYHRPDNKKPIQNFRDYANIEHSIGRSTQRFRGKRLESATASIADPSHSHIQSPSEAMISSARSISTRLAMRDPIDAIKQQAIDQYGEKYFPKQNGVIQWPNTTAEVQNSGGQLDNKKLAAARSTVEYANYLQQGYVNSIDDAWKAIVNTIGNMLGDASVKASSPVVSKAAQVAETGVRKAPRSLTAIPRQAANTFYIVTNPFRQLLVQGHQAVQLIPLDPKFFASGKAATQVMYIVSRQLGVPTQDWMLKALGMSEPEAENMFRDIMASGNIAAVDKHTLVNGALRDFTDSVSVPKTIVGKVGQTISYPIKLSRKVGFDMGEYYNQIMAWLTFRNRAIEQGKDLLDPKVQDEIAALATNFTGNMNFAGSNPYEQNALNVAFQFMGWAHRWASNLTGNRLISTGDKGKLWAWQLMMYGMIGGYGGYGVFQSILPSDPKARDAIVQGLVGSLYNKIASVISGEDVHADWASLSPFDMYGTASHMKEIMTGDVGSVIANSPAGMLFFGGNPKLTDFVKTTARWTHLIDDYGNPQDFSDVAKSFAEMFGGMSNAFKAAYALEYNKKLSSYTGKVVDENINTAQAILMAFGINSDDLAKTYYINNTMNDAYKSMKEDITNWHETKKKLMLRDDITPDELDYYLKMSGECWRVWNKYGTAGRQICNKLVTRDIETGDTRIFKQIMQMHNMLPKEQAQYIANLYPDVDAQKREEYLKILDFLYSNQEVK